MEGHYDAYPALLTPIDYLDTCIVKDMKNPPSKLLVDTEGQYEVGFRLPGYIVEKDLPPIARVAKNVSGMRQSIVISGLGLEKFTEAQKTIIAIYTYFSQSVLEGTLAPFEFKEMQGLSTLELSCHYFSRISDGTHKDIDAKVDPKGMLKKAKGATELYHNASNVVNYFKREGEEDREAGIFSKTMMDPVLIRIGHLVEVQMTFTLRPAKPKGHWYFSPTLRGISLLDTAFDKIQLQAAMAKFDNRTPPGKGIKRVGGGDEEGGDKNDRKKVRIKIAGEGSLQLEAESEEIM